MKKKIGILTLIICIIFTMFCFKQYRSEDSIAVLGYHHIVLAKDKVRYYKNHMWTDTCERFEQQMKWLKEQGYHTLTLDEFYDWHQGKKQVPKKSVVLTFDDGFLSTNKYVEPILKKYGFVGSVFVIGKLIDNDHGPFDPSLRQHASLTDMINTQTLKYYSHSYDLHHKKGDFKVNLLSKDELRKDFLLQKQLVDCKYMAYPYGKYNDTIIEVLKDEGCLMAFAYHENRKAVTSDSIYKIPRFSINSYTSFAMFQAMMNSR